MAGRFQRVVLALSLPAIITTIISIYWLRRRKKALAEELPKAARKGIPSDVFSTALPTGKFKESEVEDNALNDEMQLRETSDSVPAEREKNTLNQKEVVGANASIVVQVLGDTLKSKVTMSSEDDDKPELVKVGLHKDEKQDEEQEDVAHNMCSNNASDDQSFHSNSNHLVSTEVDAQKETCASSANGRSTSLKEEVESVCRTVDSGRNSQKPLCETEEHEMPKCKVNGEKAPRSDATVTIPEAALLEDSRSSPGSIGFCEESHSLKVNSASPSLDKENLESPNCTFSDINSEVRLIVLPAVERNLNDILHRDQATVVKVVVRVA